jgi:hypothetical protein
MADQTLSKSSTLSWDVEETLLSEILSGLCSDDGSKKCLELPTLQPSLPIIWPPEGCEKIRSAEHKDLHYKALPTPTSIRILKIFPGKGDYSDF